MPESGVNLLRLEAEVLELQAPRRTPAGIAVRNCILQHRSRQLEAGHWREVEVEVQAVVVGEMVARFEQLGPGSRVQVAGFLAARSMRTKTPVLHLTEIEFIEGNSNGFQAQVEVQEEG